MPEKSCFFDTTSEDTRYYAAREFAEYFAQFIGNGVFKGGENLKVTVTGNDSKVIINLGHAWINGYKYSVYTSPIQFTLKAATNQDRIDRVVLRLDVSKPVRLIKATIIQGTPAASPTVPALVRSGDIYDLSLAQVRVKANTTVIAANQVTDERLNNQVCGVVTGVVQQADTTTIFNEFQSWLTTKTTEYQQQWTTFMRTVQDEGFASADYVDQKTNEAKTNAQQLVNAAKTEAANTYMPKATTQATGDWNNYTTNGHYDGTDLTNAPSSGWYYVDVINHSLNPTVWVTQTAYNFNNTNIFRRTLVNSVWTPWAPVDVGQVVRVNNGILEYLDQGVWKPVSGGGQVARASDNVKYTYTEPEYSYTVQTSNFGYLKVYTIEPNIKGTFKIMADVAWGYATPQTGTYTIGLVAFSLEKNDRSNYRAGSDYPEGLAQLLTPAGTGSDSVVGLNSMGSDLSASNVTILSAQDEFKTISINIATTGEFPVCIYAIFRPQSGSGNGVILKAKNIKVCYDLV